MSATAVRPMADDPGGYGGSCSIFSCLLLSVLFEALRPIRTQWLSDHITGLPAIFGMGDPDWPFQGGWVSPAPQGYYCLRFISEPLHTLPPVVLGTFYRICWPAGGVGAANHIC